MTLGILVRKKEDVFRYFKYGQINQVVEIKNYSKKHNIKIEIIDLYEKQKFKKIKEKVDVIYDKCYSKKPKERELFKKIHQFFRIKKIPIFNNYNLIIAVGNKWRLNNLLKNKKELKKYLIPTFLYSSKKTFNLFKKYKFLILKPIWGQEGTGVIEAKRVDDHFLVSYKKKNNGVFQIKRKKIKNISDIDFLIKKLWRNNNYIIQPKIESVKFKDRIFDIRLVLQKNKKWEISGFGARVASKDSFLCNIAAGGEIFDGKYIIREVFPKRYQKIIKDIEKAAIKIGELLEKKISGIVAELGFDFMIDKKGKVCLLEINSKPSPEIFYKKTMKKMRLKMTLWPIFFAKRYYENK